MQQKMIDALRQIVADRWAENVNARMHPTSEHYDNSDMARARWAQAEMILEIVLELEGMSHGATDKRADTVSQCKEL